MTSTSVSLSLCILTGWELICDGILSHSRDVRLLLVSNIFWHTGPVYISSRLIYSIEKKREDSALPLRISHPNPIKTGNPAPARICNSRFPPLFSAQIPNITAKRGQIPHPAKPIGDPHIKHIWNIYFGTIYVPIHDEPIGQKKACADSLDRGRRQTNFCGKRNEQARWLSFDDV